MQHHMEILSWISGSSSEKENPVGTASSPPALWTVCGSPYSDLSLGDCRAICDGEGGKGLQRPAHGSCQMEFMPAIPSSNPNQQLSYLQNQVEGRLWQGNSAGVHICLIWILQWGVLLTSNLVWQAAESQHRSTVKSTFQPHLTRRPGNTLGSCVAQQWSSEK